VHVSVAPRRGHGLKEPAAFRAGWFAARVCEQLEHAVKDSARRDHAVGCGAQDVGASSKYDDFEAAIVLEMHVHRRVHLVSELVLHFGQALRQVAHVVIVNDGERADGLYRLGNLAADDLGPRQIAEHRGTGALALPHHAIELLEESSVHGDTESIEVRAHGARV